VADADRVRITERAEGDLGGGPRAKSGQGRQPPVRVREWQIDDLFEPRRAESDAADQIGPAAFEPERMEGLVRQPGEEVGRRQEPEAERTGGGLAPAGDDAAIRAAGLYSGHLLLEDCRNQ